MRRKYFILLFGLFAVLAGCGKRVKLSETRSFTIDDSLSSASSTYSSNDLCWNTDDILVATHVNRKIQTFDTKSGTEVWSREFKDDIAAITTREPYVFVLLRGYGRSGEASNLIQRFDAKTGEDSTPPDVPQPFLPDAIAWVEKLDSLCVLVNEGIWIYSGDLRSVTKKIPYEGHPFFSSAGGFALLAERNGSCTLADLSAGTKTTVHGTPHVGKRSMVVMDAPFLSNAFADGKGKLIRVVDNSWSTGSVSFHKDLVSKPLTLDSENGHAIAAIHWPTQRLAVSGTDKNLLLFDTSGQRLVMVKNAVTERTYAMAFSPSGNKVATLSSDGRIKIFEINL